MLAGMTVQQFAEWRAYADLEPFDETRGDLRAASIVATLINLHRRRKVKPSDVVLQFGESVPVVATPKAGARGSGLRAALDLWRAGVNAEAERKKRRGRRK